MKILYVTTVSMTMNFFLAPHIKMLQEAGNIVELACNMEEPLEERVLVLGCKTYDIPFSRNPFDKENAKAYRKLKAVIENGEYDIVHTHTPTASALVRLACRSYRKKGLRVFYTAHGFHFYTGAPLANWLIYYPIEKLCSYWTDTLIAITKEDYERAKKKLHAGKTVYIPGVGVDLDRFCNIGEKGLKRKELGIPENAVLLLSVGELNENKNHITVIEAIDQIDRDDIYYVICGEGDKRGDLEEKIMKYGLSDRIWLLGLRQDVPEWMNDADVYVHPSLREGLSVATMEAMASRLPVVCGDIRGSRDLIHNERGGYLCNCISYNEICDAISRLCTNPSKRKNMGEYNYAIVQDYSLKEVLRKLSDIYN